MEQVNVVPKHKCCDLCAKTCNCGDESDHVVFKEEVKSMHTELQPRIVTDKQRTQLRSILEAFYIHLNADVIRESSTISHVMQELTPEIIQSIVENCDHIFSVEDLEEMYVFCDYQLSYALFEIINDFLKKD